MTMDRRDFVKWLALIAAGAAARPEQIVAFERYYEVNTPQVASGLVSIDEILISGEAQRSLPAILEIDKPPMRFGVNLFGGILRWAAAPDAKIIAVAKDFSWRVSGDLRDLDVLHGHISFVDQEAKRHYRSLTRVGTLA